MLFPLVVGFILYVLVPVQNFRRFGTYPLSVKAILTIAAMLLYIDCAKMTGYTSGVFRLLRNRAAKRAIFGLEAS